MGYPWSSGQILTAEDLNAAIAEGIAQGQGVTGPAGPQGPQGPAGATGPQGPPGATSFAGLTGQATYAQLPNEVQSLPLGFVLVGKPPAAQVYNLMTAMAITVPSGLAGSVAYAGTAPAASAAFSVSKVSSGVTTALGTITIAPAGTVSLAGAGGSLAAGDVLRLTAPATQDTALADIGITVLAQRT